MSDTGFTWPPPEQQADEQRWWNSLTDEERSLVQAGYADIPEGEHDTD